MLYSARMAGERVYHVLYKLREFLDYTLVSTVQSSYIKA